MQVLFEYDDAIVTAVRLLTTDLLYFTPRLTITVLGTRRYRSQSHALTQ